VIESLKHKTFHSTLWVAVDVFGERSLQFVIGIILARLLLPEDFGILGLIAVFFSFSMVFVDSGFSFALIRKKTISSDELNTVFWFNLIISVFFYIILWISSKAIASFFAQPLLISIIKVASFNLIINALGTVQQVTLHRKLKFKELAYVGIVSKIISGCLALYLAHLGYGVWSLVAQQISANVVRIGLMFYFARLIPGLYFSTIAFRSLFSFSSKLLYGGIVYSIVANIYPMVIGKFFTISDVGFFNRAQSFQQLPVRTFTSIIQKVSLPIFSQIQDDDERFKRAYQNAIKTAFFLISLPLVVIIVASHPLLTFLLTEKWLPAADILRVLAIGGFFYPLSALNVNIIGIKGRSDFVMYLQFIKDALSVIALLVGILWGINGLVWSYSLTSVLSYFLNAYFANRVIEYSIKEQIKDISPIALIVITSGIISSLLMVYAPTDVSKILLVITTSSIIYFSLSAVLNLSALRETINLLKYIVKKKQ
jgi:teichuronic acid exporter